MFVELKLECAKDKKASCLKYGVKILNWNWDQMRSQVYLVTMQRKEDSEKGQKGQNQTVTELVKSMNYKRILL